MSLKDKLGKMRVPAAKGPVWAGPESKEKNGGITFSLLSRFFVCRERFRLLVVEGLRTKERFDHKLEFGNMWHLCEECILNGVPYAKPLLEYAQGLAAKYQLDREAISHWYEMTVRMFPEYMKFWKLHDKTDRETVFAEQVFCVPYKLPSGRVVYLRGKWDGGEVTNKRSEFWLQENKTKSQIDGLKIQRQLRYDLQTMLYLIALGEQPSCDLHREGYYRHGGGKSVNGVTTSGGVKAGEYQIRGVRYNVVRRSAHKTSDSMYKKLTEDIADNRGNEWFSRWNVDILPHDIKRFKERTLNPILDQLCLWWDHITGTSSKESPFWVRCPPDNDYMVHWQHPYGVYNVLDEGGSSDLDAYLETGSEVGLTRTTNLFPELS